MNESPTPAGTPSGGGQPVAGSPATVEDLVATLAAMQDQIDDLTAVVEAHARRLAELDGAHVTGRSTARPRGRAAR